MAKKKAKKKHIETDIQKAIVASCQRPHIWLMRVNSGLVKMGKYAIHLAPAGTADIMGCKRCKINGCTVAVTIWIEVKKPGEHPTEIQQEFLDKMAKLGCIVGCAHSVIEAFDILGIAHS